MLNQIKSVLNRNSGEIFHEPAPRWETGSTFISAHEIKHTRANMCVYTQGRGEQRREHRGVLSTDSGVVVVGSLGNNKDVYKQQQQK